MYEAYIKSLQMIKENKITNKKEYAKLVKEHNLLNFVTLEYITRKKFRNIVKNVSKKVA